MPALGLPPRLRWTIGIPFVAILLLVMSGRRHSTEIPRAIVVQLAAVSVPIPRPGYLDDCPVPEVALRPGEQRRVDFECPGNLSEDQFWWARSAWPSDVTVVLADDKTRTSGLCGALFLVSFTTPMIYGDVTSQPGRGCGRFRRYCARVQRPRHPGRLDPWTVSLQSPRCGEGDWAVK